MGTEIISDTVLEWFQNLDYEYMILQIIVCYGLYYSPNMRWIVQWFSPVQKKGISKAVWVIGAFLAGLEMIKFLPFMFSDTNVDHQKFFYIFYSYVVIQVFVGPIVEIINKWVNIFQKNISNPLKD